MLINFDTDLNINHYSHNNIVQNTERAGAAKPDSGKEDGSSFVVSIGDGIAGMGGSIVKDKSSLEELQESLSATDVEMKTSYMSVMSLSMSDEDFAEMARTGQVPDDMDVSDSVTILDDIKAAIIRGGTQVKGYTDDIDPKTLEEITGSVVAAEALISSLQRQDVAVNSQTVSAATDAIRIASGVLPVSDAAVLYMVNNQLPPTIQNIYHAAHASSEYREIQSSEDVAAELVPQIEETLRRSGLEVTPDRMSDAKWLVANGAALTSENIYALESLNELRKQPDTEQITEAVTIAISAGIPADEANLTYQTSIYTQAEKYIDRFDAISPQAIDLVADVNQELNLSTIESAQARITEASPEASIHAQRVMEEIRLSMTVQANRMLLRSNYQIDTAPLEELVEALKLAEKEISNRLFGTDDAQAAEKGAMLRQTQAQLLMIPSLPAAILGQKNNDGYFIFEDEKVYSLHKVIEVGVSRSQLYARAGESYETLMSAPRADLGDSIRKAFRNVDDILADLQIELTDENRKAVRILGYNQMEITPDNIELVSKADSELRKTLNRLSPARVIGMIRENVNPLNMSLEELNNYLDSQDKEPERQAQNYAKFLLSLERQNEITELEKDSYIGIYRMISKLGRTDDAAVGRLLELGTQTSFASLLSAIRSMSHSSMDYKIGDDFAGVDSLRSNIAIDEQINAAFTIERYAEASSTTDTVIENLLMSGEKVSLSSVDALNQLKNKRGDWYRIYTDAVGEETDPVDGIIDSLTGRDETIKAYNQMLDEMNDKLGDAVYEADHYIDVKAIQSSIKQISILQKMSGDEHYEIPVSINGEKTSIRLEIRHSERAGHLAISMSTESTGRVAAEFSFADRSGYIAYEKEDAKLQLEQVVAMLSDELGFAPGLVHSDRLNLDKYTDLRMNSIGQKDESTLNNSQNMTDINNAELYGIAKKFITAIDSVWRLQDEN